MPRTCALLLLALGPALAGITHPTTALPEESPSVSSGPAAVSTILPSAPAEPEFIVGEVDTVGGTTYDWVANGPMYRMICNSPDFGVHVIWMYSASQSGTTFPDRNMRYNFYDYASGDWNWLDPDFMSSGVNIYTERSGYGCIDAAPSGIAYAICHNGTPLRPVAARDMAPGAGIFEFSNSSPQCEAYQWPPFVLTSGLQMQVALVDNATQDQLWYTRCDPWTTWQVPVSIVGSAPDPAFPTHNVAASKVSNKVCIVWMDYNSSPGAAYYRVSNDGGLNWNNTVNLTTPTAYQGDTLTSFHITSLFPYYDRHDRLHIAAGVNPIVRDTSYILPAEIWHWCESNSPQWSKIHRGTCNPINLQAAVGYNALYACRPSLGEDRFGGLYVTWEQFDSSNVEVSTSLLRGDIFYAQDNGNNGQTWRAGIKITDRTTGSHRFPSCVDYLSSDTLWVLYEIDRIAGMYVMGVGAVSLNPIICHRVPVVVGVAEEQRSVPTTVSLSAGRNPFRGQVSLSYSLPCATEASLVVYDMTGRKVTRLVCGPHAAGRYLTSWQPQGLAPGVYLARLTAGDAIRTAKLMLAN